MKLTHIVFLMLLAAKLTFYRELPGWWLACPLIIALIAGTADAISEKYKKK